MPADSAVMLGIEAAADQSISQPAWALLLPHTTIPGRVFTRFKETAMAWFDRIENHFTKERKLHSWEMLYVRISAWTTVIGLVLYGLLIVGLLLYAALRFLV